MVFNNKSEVVFSIACKLLPNVAPITVHHNSHSQVQLGQLFTRGDLHEPCSNEQQEMPLNIIQ